jgi:hypothetical protein
MQTESARSRTSCWGGSIELMDRRAIVGTALRFGAISGVFALCVQLITFYVIRNQGPWTSITGAMLELLIIGEAGRLGGRTTGRVAAGVWTGALAGGLSELINHSLGDVAFPYSPAGHAAYQVLSAVERAQVSDPQYIILSLLVSVVSLVAFGALYGGLGAWAEVRAKP